MLKWTIGDVTITRVVEMEFSSPVEQFLPGVKAADMARYRSWMKPFLDGAGGVLLSVHAFALEADGQRIIVDTCVGNGKNFGDLVLAFNDLQTAFLDDLAEAGFPPESVSTVICTHLHMDHIGWNTVLRDGKWAPAFPNARYVMTEMDLSYWSEHQDHVAGSSFSEAVQPLVDAGLVDAVEPDRQVSPSISLFPTPGHTPGHVSVRIHSNGRQGFITGDMVHSPVQLARPQWSSQADTDATMAEASRRKFLSVAADADILVLGTHFPTPTAGRLVSDGDEWRLVT